MLSQSSIDKDEILTTYYLEGGRITGMVTDDTLWRFLYYRDTLIGFETGGERYYYLRNLQGDIIQIIDEDGEGDYHFMVQHNDGTWSHKPGFCGTRLINGANPSVVSWDAPQINSFHLYAFGIVREIGAISNYYDSKTVYFAVTK